MKKVLLSLCASVLVTTGAFASDTSAKGLNVLLTSADAQTQMMGMVLSTMTLKQNKVVNMVLCSSAAYIGELGHLNRKHLDSLCKNIF